MSQLPDVNPGRCDLPEQSRLTLFQTVAGHLKGDDYSVLRIGCESLKVIATNRMGVEAIRLLGKKKTIGEVRLALTARHGRALDIQPVIRALMNAGMVRKIDDRVIEPEAPRTKQVLRHYAQFSYLSASRKLTAGIARHLPARVAHDILFWFRSVRKGRKIRHSALQARANLDRIFGPLAPPDTIDDIVASWTTEQIRSAIDGDLFGNMPPQRLKQWLTRHVDFYGLEHIEAASRQGRGVILCGLHFASVYLLVAILWMRGYSFTGSGSPRGGWVRNEPVLNLEGPGCGKVRWFTKADFRGAVEMLKALQRGEMILGFADGILGRSKEALEHYGHRSAIHPAATSEVAFLGHRVAANTGIAWYHLQSGAAVLPIKILRKRGAKLQVVVEPAIDLSGMHDLQSVAAAIYRVLEKDVSFHPAQWAYWDRLQQLQIA